MKTRIYKEGNTEYGHKFWIHDFGRAINPCVSRSALDACDNVNGELCEQLNELGERLFAINPEIAADEIGRVLNSLGYVCIEEK